VGWTNIFHCEIKPFCNKILKYYWPKAISYGDITKTNFTIHRGQIDVLTGGFPCQPFSIAGKRKGTADHRNLWPEMFRAIHEIQPVWVVGENVPGIINWSEGLVFEQVQTDLENEGYEVLPVILPACSVNAPHKRERVWFVAYRTNTGIESMRQKRQNPVYEFGVTPDTKSKGLEGQNGKRMEETVQFTKPDITDTESNHKQHDGICPEKHKKQIRRCFSNTSWQNFPTQSPICSRNDGLSSRLDGITLSKWRNESIKAYGNAIVPQVAYQKINHKKGNKYEKRLD